MKSLRNLVTFFTNEKSKDAAKERLKLVLVHDRANVSPELLEKLRTDLMDVLSKYTEIDTEDLQISLTRVESDEGDRVIPALVANIPIKAMKIR